MSESTAAASSTLQLLDGDQTIMIPSASSSGTSMVHSAAHIRRSPTNTVSVTPTSAAATTTTTSSSHHHTTTTTSTSSVAASTHLGARLVGDVLVATAVTAAVAPFLTVVDQAIVESTAGSKTLVRSGLDSIRFMTSNPGSYVRSPTFLLMWGVYAATYATANSFKTLEEHSRFQEEASRTTNTTSSSSSSSASSIGLGQVGIFLGTTVVNSGTSMMKDRAYAQMFGSGTASVTFPKASYAFWALRDLSVIGSSFILPDLVATKLAGDYGMDKATALSYCQLTIPVATQLIAGPFHFLGLDVYNRNLNHLASRWSVAADRMRQLSQSFGPVVMARMARIAPGYGIGGVWNTKLRMAWRDHLVERQIKHIMRDGGTTNSSNNNRSTGLVALLYGVKSRVW